MNTTPTPEAATEPPAEDPSEFADLVAVVEAGWIDAELPDADAEEPPAEEPEPEQEAPPATEEPPDMSSMFAAARTRLRQSYPIAADEEPEPVVADLATAESAGWVDAEPPGAPAPPPGYAEPEQPPALARWDDDELVVAQFARDNLGPFPGYEFPTAREAWTVAYGDLRLRLDPWDTEPAVFHRDQTSIRMARGVYHQVGAPAVLIDRGNGGEFWFVNGWLHRLDGPAVTIPGEGEWWIQHGLLHRLDGPAYVPGDGLPAESQWACWAQFDLPHRTDGPAVEFIGEPGSAAGKPDEWWYRGVSVKRPRSSRRDIRLSRRQYRRVMLAEPTGTIHSPAPSIDPEDWLHPPIAAL